MSKVYMHLFVLIILLFCSCAVKKKSFEFEFKNNKMKLSMVTEEVSKNASSKKTESSPNVEVKIYGKNYVNFHWVWLLNTKVHFYAYHGEIINENGEVFFLGNIIWNGKLKENIKCKINGGEDLDLNLP